MGTRLVEQMRYNFTPYTEKVPHLTQEAPSKPLECPTCLGRYHRKQCRVDDQGLRISDQLAEHDPAQGLQEAP